MGLERRIRDEGGVQCQIKYWRGAWEVSGMEKEGWGGHEACLPALTLWHSDHALPRTQVEEYFEALRVET